MENESGIIAIINLKTDKKYIFFAENIEQEIINQRFNLDLGMHKNKNLQKEYSKIGLEIFTFKTLEITKDSSRLDYWKSHYSNQY